MRVIALLVLLAAAAPGWCTAEVSNLHVVQGASKDAATADLATALSRSVFHVTNQITAFCCVLL